MPIRNEAQRWGWVSLGIHWLTVVMVLCLCAVGLLMDELSNSPFKVQVYALHKSFGLTVLGLTVLRLLWRLAAGAPQPVPGTPRWQVLAAGITHGALYVILLAMPLSGWLFNSASGFPLKWFGQFPLPKLSGYDPAVKAFAHDLHETLFLVLAAIVTAHALAALKHHYLDRDRTLVRMLPLLKPREPAAPAPVEPIPPVSGS
jgi:cytochrome b561